MITSFNTSGGSSSSASTGGNSTTTLVYVLLAGAALYCGYRFWWKPMQDKKKLEAQK